MVATAVSSLSPQPLRGGALLLGVLVGCSSGGSRASPDGSFPTDAAREPPGLLLRVSPLALQPSFSPEVRDYYVRCAAGSNTLTVAVTAPPGTSASIRQHQGGGDAGPVYRGTTTLDVLEDQAIVVDVTSSGSTGEYWVRCLPHDFPGLSMELHPEAGTPPPGFYFLGNTYKATGDAGNGEGGYAMVLDVRGTPVWYGKTFDNAGAKDTDLLDSNTVSYVPLAGYSFGTYLGSFELHTLNPVGVTYVAAVGQPVDTHELRVRKNGNYLMFGDRIDLGVDLTDVHPDGAPPKFTTNEDAVDCTLQEVSPTGALVWSWRASDHIDLEKETVQIVTQLVHYVDGTAGALPDDAGKVLVRDPLHCNAIDEDPSGSGNLLISARNTDALFYIQHDAAHAGTPDDGKILWKLGGTPYSKDGARLFQVVGDKELGFHRQHHVRYLSDGTLTLFDDHTLAPGAARGVQLRVDVDAGTASIFWEYPFPNGESSIGMGSFQVLGDGSRVVGWGYPPAGTHLAFTEVDFRGASLLDFSFPNAPEASYRALKYPASAVDLGMLRASVGPWSSEKGAPMRSANDAGPDARLDAGPDAGPDARGGDAQTDAAHDSGGADAGSDAVRDAHRSADAALDAGSSHDGGREAVDAARDAGVRDGAKPG